MPAFEKNDIMSLVSGSPPYDLAESVGPDIRLGEFLGSVGIDDLDDIVLSYGSAQGDPRLRQLIARAHGVGDDDVITMVGGMQALFLSAFILCGPGDEAVAATPIFPSALNVLKVTGATLRTLPLDFSNQYQLSANDLGAMLSPKTRLVCLASPQNPSGVALKSETVGEILDLMAETCPDAVLLIDETYRAAAYGEEKVAKSMVGLSPRIISCASLSKCHGAPGLRAGWLIVKDEYLREQFIVGKFNTVISCSRIDEALAIKVLENEEMLIRERRARLADGLGRTQTWVEANQDWVEWVRPDAGALCCIRMRPERFDKAAVGRFYQNLQTQGVRVANGAWFGEQPRVFRLGFGFMAMEGLDAGLKGLSVAIAQTIKDAA